MKKIIVIKTAPYSYKLPGRTLYNSFDAVARNIVDPGITGTYEKEYEGKGAAVFCSPRRRATQSAQLISHDFTQLPELREIEYKMSNFISRKEFYRYGSPNVTLARKRFFRALVSGNLDESFASVIARIQRVIDMVSQSSPDKVIVISHGFFIKVFEAYIHDRSIKRNPQRLLNYFDGSHESFGFGEGFEINL